MSEHRIELTISGQLRTAHVEGRTMLGDFLRGEAGCNAGSARPASRCRCRR